MALPVRRAIPIKTMTADTANKAGIVVVEDDPDLRQSLEVLLELDGYDVRTAPDAETALQLVDQRLPDCVLLDLGLPGVNGIELTRQLRARHGSGLLLVVLTGWSKEEYGQAAEAAGVDHIMLKPFEMERLRRVLPPAR